VERRSEVGRARGNGGVVCDVADDGGGSAHATDGFGRDWEESGGLGGIFRRPGVAGDCSGAV
jgi:hypothetical protein